MHTSLSCQPVAMVWKCFEAMPEVMGPGGLDDGYPSQPPRRPMIQAAQAMLSGGYGFLSRFACGFDLPIESVSAAISLALEGNESGLLAAACELAKAAW